MKIVRVAMTFGQVHIRTIPGCSRSLKHEPCLFKKKNALTSFCLPLARRVTLCQQLPSGSNLVALFVFGDEPAMLNCIFARAHPHFCPSAYGAGNFDLDATVCPNVKGDQLIHWTNYSVWSGTSQKACVPSPFTEGVYRTVQWGSIQPIGQTILRIWRSAQAVGWTAHAVGDVVRAAAGGERQLVVADPGNAMQVCP